MTTSEKKYVITLKRKAGNGIKIAIGDIFFSARGFSERRIGPDIGDNPAHLIQAMPRDDCRDTMLPPYFISFEPMSLYTSLGWCLGLAPCLRAGAEGRAG